MALTSAQLDEWASAYIAAKLLPDDELTHTHPLWWSVNRLMNLTDEVKAEDAWIAIREVLARTGKEEVLEVLAAGPLEELISKWGSAFIGRIEDEAAVNPRFRALLRGVWEGGDSSVCERVVAARRE